MWRDECCLLDKGGCSVIPYNEAPLFDIQQERDISNHLLRSWERANLRMGGWGWGRTEEKMWGFWQEGIQEREPLQLPAEKVICCMKMNLRCPTNVSGALLVGREGWMNPHTTTGAFPLPMVCLPRYRETGNGNRRNSGQIRPMPCWLGNETEMLLLAGVNTSIIICV